MSKRWDKSETGLFFNLLTHEGWHREVYQESQLSYDIIRRLVQGLFRPQVLYTPAYTTQLLTLHSTEPTTSIGRLIKSSQLFGLAATLRQQSPIQILTGSTLLDFSDNPRTGIDKPLHPL